MTSSSFSSSLQRIDWNWEFCIILKWKIWIQQFFTLFLRRGFEFPGSWILNRWGDPDSGYFHANWLATRLYFSTAICSRPEKLIVLQPIQPALTSHLYPIIKYKGHFFDAGWWAQARWVPPPPIPTMRVDLLIVMLLLWLHGWWSYDNPNFGAKVDDGANIFDDLDAVSDDVWCWFRNTSTARVCCNFVKMCLLSIFTAGKKQSLRDGRGGMKASVGKRSNSQCPYASEPIRLEPYVSCVGLYCTLPLVSPPIRT